MSESPDRAAANAETLTRELVWLARVIETRIAILGGDPGGVTDIPPPDVAPEGSMYASFIHHYELGFEERLAVILALAPRVRPQILDALFRVNESVRRGFTEFGGVQGKAHGGFLPTGETAVYLLAGEDLHRRFLCQQMFERDHFFASHGLLRLETAPPGEPLLAGQLQIADEIADFLTTGELRRPDYSREFPARLVTTEMEWDDLVLDPTTREEIRELEAWIRHEGALMKDWDLDRRMRPGYRCLFYGPPGTGKTLTATLMGKRLRRDVYRISLSAVVSKYIGETEKNLERIFERAESLSCLLFFDEADALFGKRTSVSDAHDRYANQEVSYLLQRIEEYAGVVILASNFNSNIDEAFTRRFQAVVNFPMPGEADRKRLWSASFSRKSELDESVSLDEISRKYELSGGAIMNVVRYASLMALDEDTTTIRRQNLIGGIRREMQKDGKTL